MKIVKLTNLKGGKVYVNGNSVAFWRLSVLDTEGNPTVAHTRIVFTALSGKIPAEGFAMDLRVKEQPEEVATKFMDV